MKKSPAPAPTPAANPQAGLVLVGLLVGVIGLIAWALWPAPSYTAVPVAMPTPKKLEAFVMPDEKAAFAQYAGSKSCQECHAAEFEKWQSSHHGLAERAPKDDLDLAGFQPAQSFTHGAQTTEAAKKDGRYEITALGFDHSVRFIQWSASSGTIRCGNFSWQVHAVRFMPWRPVLIPNCASGSTSMATRIASRASGATGPGEA
jgi:hypothetical protein